MPELVLHHYAASPFSEKLRLILGHKKLAWRSVTVPSISPKPDVVALTGGYRKTPFLQIGSHIYCDTALACDVLEHMAPEPALYPAQHKGLARVLAQWADDKLFWAAMAWNLHPEGSAEYDRYLQRQMEAQIESGAATGTLYNNLAWHYVERKMKPAEALAYARKAVEMEPNQSFILDTLGWAHLRNGQYAEALRVFGEVFDRFPYEAQGAASSWRGVMEIAQAPGAAAALRSFCDKTARGADSKTQVRLHAVQAESYRRQGGAGLAQTHWRQTGFTMETNWLVLGPFNNATGMGLYQAFIPEEASQPDLQKEYAGRRGPCRWEPRASFYMN